MSFYKILSKFSKSFPVINSLINPFTQMIRITNFHRLPYSHKASPDIQQWEVWTLRWPKTIVPTTTTDR